MHAGSVLVLISSSCQFKYMKLDHLFIISRPILKNTKENSQFMTTDRFGKLSRA